jgi:hypothetical protein
MFNLDSRVDYYTEGLYKTKTVKKSFGSKQNQVSGRELGNKLNKLVMRPVLKLRIIFNFQENVKHRCTQGG